MLPMLVVMILVGLLRSNATQLMNTKPKQNNELIRENQGLQRSMRFRTSTILDPDVVERRKEWMKVEVLKWMKEREEGANPMRFG